VESKKMSPAGIVGIIGGVVVIIGSFLSWATVSIDVDAFAKAMSDALGVPVSSSDLATAGVNTSQSISGFDADGKLTLVAGIIVVVGAVVFLAARARVAGSILMLVGGVGGAGIALYDIVSKDNQIDKAIADAGPTLTQLGLNADTFKSVFSVSWAIGIYACVIGGIVAVIAGIMALMARTAEPAMPAMSGTPAGGGLGAPVGTPTDTPPMSPPATPSTPAGEAAPPATPAPPPEPPAPQGGSGGTPPA
jgi:hypothetical protein